LTKLKHLEIENALQVMKLPDELELYTVKLVDEGSYFLLAIKGFDDWYGQFLIKEKSKVENLSEGNFNEIYRVLTQIEDQLQFSQSGMFSFNFIDSSYDLQGYEREDMENLVSAYLKVLNYLKNAKVLKDFSHSEMSFDADISLNIGYFYEILEKAKIRKGISKDKPEPKLKTGKVEKENSIDVFFDNKIGELKIMDKKVKLRKDSLRGKLIALLLENKQSKKKIWNWDEILEKIEGIKDDEGLKENKKKFYPACDGVAKFIAQKTGVNDLLLFDNSTVQINPKYI